MRMRPWLAGQCLAVSAVVTLLPVPGSAQGMDLRQASGVPLPAADLPAGTVSVRVVRESFANNVANQAVVFRIDGAERTVVTDSGGRAQVADLAAGATVSAYAVVAGERVESQQATLGSSGIRFVLVAGLGPPATPSPAAVVPAVPGRVTLGRDSRIVLDFSDERLNVYYVVQVLNDGSAPVDLGGPLVFDLPETARGTTVMDGSTPNAKPNGARVVVTGPFAPGRTDVNIAFELPFSGSTAHLEQAWPADAERFSVFALKTGEMDLESTQLTDKRQAMEQGQPIIVGVTPALGQGERLTVAVTGLPSHPVWPRNTALGVAGIVVLGGLWAAFGPASRRRMA